MKKTVWILKDNKLGSVHILDGISYFLDMNIVHKEIKYNKLAKLPNFISKFFNLGITKESRETLKAPWPDVVLAAGRRAAVVAAWIKKQAPSTYVVQVLMPNYSSSAFDLVVMPKHGQSVMGKNVLYLDILPHWIHPDNVEKQKKAFAPLVKELKGPYITVIIGGSTKTTTFDEEMALEFASELNKLAKSKNASLLVLNSRRTGEAQSKIIKDNLSAPYVFYDHKEPNASSAFAGFLGWADYIAITGESISMLTESTFANKPIFVYDNDNLLTKKHKQFVNILYKLGAAKKIQEMNSELKLVILENSGKKVAEVILKNMKERK